MAARQIDRGIRRRFFDALTPPWVWEPTEVLLGLPSLRRASTGKRQ